HEAAHAQPRCRRIGGMPGLVLVSSHEWNQFDDDVPRFRDADLEPAHHRGHVDDRFAAWRRDGFAEIEFAAAHEGGDVGALEARRRDAAVDAAEDRYRRYPLGGIARLHLTPIHRLPDDVDADADQDQ